MHIDDIVVYTKSHHEWLRQAQTVNTYATRLGHTGRVLEVGDGFTRVHWTDTDRVSCHFPDNLEVLRRRTRGAI